MIKKVRSHHDFMWSYSKVLAKHFTRPALIFLFFTIGLSVVLSAIAFYHFEHTINSKITTHFDSFYYTVTIFSGVGLGDIAPVTTEGRILSMFIMLIGTAMYISLTAVIAATILSIEILPLKADSIKTKYQNENPP